MLRDYLFLSFQRTANENNTAKNYRDSLSDYYLPKVEIKDFINGKSFFDLSLKNKVEGYKKV